MVNSMSVNALGYRGLLLAAMVALADERQPGPRARYG
jgi:hypothetical protein